MYQVYLLNAPSRWLSWLQLVISLASVVAFVTLTVRLVRTSEEQKAIQHEQMNQARTQNRIAQTQMLLLHRDSYRRESDGLLAAFNAVVNAVEMLRRALPHLPGDQVPPMPYYDALWEIPHLADATTEIGLAVGMDLAPHVDAILRCHSFLRATVASPHPPQELESLGLGNAIVRALEEWKDVAQPRIIETLQGMQQRLRRVDEELGRLGTTPEPHP